MKMKFGVLAGTLVAVMMGLSGQAVLTPIRSSWPVWRIPISGQPPAGISR